MFEAGGGASVQELQPSWETGVVSEVSTSMRTSPDVTFDGNGVSAVAVYDSSYQGVGLPWTYGDGTSISAPSWAALLAIIDQGEVLAGKSAAQRTHADVARSVRTRGHLGLPARYHRQQRRHHLVRLRLL